MTRGLSKDDIDKYKNKFNISEYQLNNLKYDDEIYLHGHDFKNLLDINVNPNLLLEIRTFYEYSGEFKEYINNHGCELNEKILYSVNPTMNMFSYGYDLNKLKKLNLIYDYSNIYDPHNLDYAIQNPNDCNYIDYEDFLEIYISGIYDFIISKEFYDIIIEYKYNYPECDKLWNMWLNINSYSIDLLFNDDILDFDFISLNPKCFEIFEKYKNTNNYDNKYDYLNNDLLFANPSIMNYNYDNIIEKNKKIKEELIMKLYHPDKISKFININGIENIDDYLN